jgi:hypothetical protein
MALEGKLYLEEFRCEPFTLREPFVVLESKVSRKTLWGATKRRPVACECVDVVATLSG